MPEAPKKVVPEEKVPMFIPEKEEEEPIPEKTIPAKGTTLLASYP